MNDFLENNWERLTSLWRRPEEGELSQEEKKILQQQFEIRQAMHGLESHRYDVDNAWRKIQPKRGRKWMLSVCKYAAMFVLGVSLVYVVTRPEPEEKIVRAEVIKPGRLQAELRLGTGVRLALNEHQGVYSSENAGVEIVNDTVAGKVSYHVNKTGMEDSLVFNTLIVPKGGEYSLELPDGTVVWVNSESSLRFPEKFTSNRREVFLEGEAYFEVKKDANRPFYVHTEAGKVRVLGTAFNVCAYSNDRFWQTTLVEGSVMINQEEKEVLLKPNEQYQIDVRTGKAGLREVLPELYTSWRDGKFYFKAYTFEELVEKLERWYDFKMFYMNEEIKTRRFSGVVNKYQPLEEMFKFLQMTSDVQFNVKGNVVTASLKNR
ncbi:MULTISPECIES: FecR family protein [Butyricimonas]|uniref:FecR family protein n=1 Tax=Butyricimonas TaxID=574697 RepID=UPI00207DA0C5|nr:FecR domain-containing protein [Butyricimonas paravirosa]BDF54894.1 iron dicitrate transporter FecR [Odoribacteraceae bacterium]GKH93756.1 iron dicitrate transporter FecR [Odoribacteraceae bacterium]GKH99358.1 iron dicitrate transporter FecR [Odoribacteraceae bacterium]GKI02823.1 iron dicitrate transporter FecR [Odoribacteraceae bacterium]